MSDPLTATVDGLVALIDDAGGIDRLITPRGWPHLGLVIIDAVFSLQADYGTIVKPMLKRYCEEAPGLTWATAGDDSVPEHDASHLVDFLGPLALEERSRILNRQVGPGTAHGGREGYPKAQIVVDLARSLVDHRVVTRADFVAAAASDPGLEWVVRRVPGVGFACWKYMLNLAGVQSAKPDTMVMRWLAEVTETDLDEVTAATLIEDATSRLQATGLPVTVRQIDHLVWRKASDRPLGADPDRTAPG